MGYCHHRDAVSAAVASLLLSSCLTAQDRFGADPGLRFNPVADPVEQFELGDFDQDGDLDVVTVYSFVGGQSPRLFVNTGQGTFVEAKHQLPLIQSATVCSVDVDGDSDLDLVLGGIRRSGSRLLLNDGTGTFSDAPTPLPPFAGATTQDIAAFDADGDGDQDLLFANVDVRSRLLVNDGTGVFAHRPNAIPLVPRDGFRVAVGDVDGDGDLDVALGLKQYYGLSFQLWINDGRTSGGGWAGFRDATTQILTSAVGRTTALEFGDLDGDGDLDLVQGNDFRDYYNVRLASDTVYLNDGSGRFTGRWLGRTASLTRAVALGDVDEDGDLDVVSGGSASNGALTLRVWENDGSAGFQMQENQVPGAPQELRTLGLADLDGDLDLDVLGHSAPVLNTRVGRMFAVAGLRRHLQAPAEVVPGSTSTWDLRAFVRSPGVSGSFAAATLLSPGTGRLVVPGWGLVGLDLSRTLALPTLTVPQPSGLGVLSVPVPSDPALTGTSFYAQSLVLDGRAVDGLTNVVRTDFR